jgi:hypothetical protein
MKLTKKREEEVLRILKKYRERQKVELSEIGFPKGKAKGMAEFLTMIADNVLNNPEIAKNIEQNPMRFNMALKNAPTPKEELNSQLDFCFYMSKLIAQYTMPKHNLKSAIKQDYKKFD